MIQACEKEVMRKPNEYLVIQDMCRDMGPQGKHVSRLGLACGGAET